MANKIQIRRGVKESMPQGSAGEPLWASDTKELYMGTGNGNVNMSGSHWYRGTAMSGTSTTANAYGYSACPEVKLDDIYMNTSNGNIYACTTAGKGSTAKWTYQGCMKGPQGAKGEQGSYFPSNGYANMDELSIDVKDIMMHYLAPPCTFTIGCADSYQYGFATYACDGTNDTSQFNKAVSSLPSIGGKIAVLEGTYDISQYLNVQRNVVFEGMGRGTIININEYIHVGDINVSFRNCTLNFNINDNEGLKVSRSSNVNFDNCVINVVSNGGHFAWAGVRDISVKHGSVTMTNCDFTYTLNDFTNCSNIFTNFKKVKISNCDIVLKNNASVSYSTSYNCNVNLIMDDYINVSSASKEATSAFIDNCYIKCVGKQSANGKSSMACVSHSPGTLISNSRIELDDYGSISQLVSVASEPCFSVISNCEVIAQNASSSTDIYIGGRIFTNNILNGDDRTIRFAPSMVVSANDISTRVDAKVYNNGPIIFTNNYYNRQTSSLTTNASKVIADNLT